MTLLNIFHGKIWGIFKKKERRFLRNTSMLVLKYVISDTKCLWGFKLSFLIVFLAVIFGAVHLAVGVFKIWQNTPVIIGISSTLSPIKNIPFPAITVCNMNQAKKSKVEHMMSGTLGYAMLQKTCYRDFNYTLTDIQQENETFPNFIKSISEKCEDLIVSCTFHQNKIPCTDIFREIFVDEGLCCIFNFLHPYYLYKFKSPYIRDYTSSDRFADIAVDWDPISGYPKRLPTSYYPRPGVGVGTTMGLQIILNGRVNDYFCSSTNGQGFKVLLYNPIDQPRMKESGLPVMIGHQTSFRIIARSFIALPNIRNIHRTSRQCIFSDEQQLLFYRYYTRRNCEAECDALFYLRLCNCIPYYLPLVYSNVSICDVVHFKCLNSAELEIFDVKSLQCKELCLPSCNDLIFFPDSFATPFSQNHVNINKYFQNMSSEYIRQNLAVINFFHTDNYFRSSVRTSYTGSTEYMALTGGILSLMIGFSVIIIAEIIYIIFLVLTVILFLIL